MWGLDIFAVEYFVSMLIKKGCHNVRVSFSPKRDLSMGWLVTWLDPHQPNLTGTVVKISEADRSRAMAELATRGA